MKNNIFSPFYTINKKNELIYLDKYKICKLSNENEIKEIQLYNEGVLFSSIERKKYNKTILVLEPHSDDFVLSALGYCLDKYNVEVFHG